MGCVQNRPEIALRDSDDENHMDSKVFERATDQEELEQVRSQQMIPPRLDRGANQGNARQMPAKREEEGVFRMSMEEDEETNEP